MAVSGILTLAWGGSTGKTYGFAALFLGLAALVGAAGYWELTLARSAPRPPRPRTPELHGEETS